MLICLGEEQKSCKLNKTYSHRPAEIVTNNNVIGRSFYNEKQTYFEAFGSNVIVLFSRQVVKCDRILGIFKQACVGDVPFKSPSAKAIANKPQLYPSLSFCD